MMLNTPDDRVDGERGTRLCIHVQVTPRAPDRKLIGVDVDLYGDEPGGKNFGDQRFRSLQPFIIRRIVRCYGGVG